jgi:ISXO2-like transposase domain/Transposase zinc-ribbon domain
MNLVTVTKEFRTDDDCRAYLEKVRWPKGVRCERCDGAKVNRMSVPQTRRKVTSTREVLECASCHYQFSVTAGTVFHDSHLPLTTWFMVVAMMCEAKKGVSANQVKRHFGIQYRTAWYLCHRIRKAMEAGNIFGKLGGGGKIVEADETYIGGKYDKRRKRGPYEKQGVMGIVERGGKIRTELISTPSKAVLIGKIREHVAQDVKIVMTDEATAYQKLGQHFPHAVVNHSALEFVRGGVVHTNTVENHWSLLKRGIVGSFHKVSVKHLPLYLTEFSYRYNQRDDQANLFAQTMTHLVNSEHMTYAALIGKRAEPKVPF